MLPRRHPDRIQIAFDDHRLVTNAGLILPATLALHLGVKGGEKVYHCGGGIVYDPHDEKELNWESGGVRSGAGVRRSGLSQESSGSSETW